MFIGSFLNVHLPQKKFIFFIKKINQPSHEKIFLKKKNFLKINMNFKEKNYKKKNEEFFSWLSSNNAYIFNRSTWGRAPHPCFVSEDVTDEGEPCGRGLLAYRKISQGEKLVEIPENLILKKDFTKNQFENLNFLNEYDSLAIKVIQEKAMGEKSNWKIYYNILPNEKDLNLVFRWKSSDIVFLRGSKILKASLYLKEKIKIQFLKIEKTIFSKNRLNYPEKIFNLKSWEWAISILLSRAIFLQNSKKVALVPYADFINHNPFSNSYIDSKKVAFSENNEIVMYADKDYNKFDQIFTTYGPKTNLELLVLYGFIIERNPFDSIELRITLSSKDILYEKKKKFIQDCEKPSQITFPVFYYKYPKELYEFMRLCLLNPYDFSKEEFSDINFTDEGNQNLEKIVRKTVIFACKKNLKLYSKNINEEKILNSLNNIIVLTKNQKTSIKQRKCEKKILQRLNDNLKKELN